jgi:hypothetical protein
MKRFLLLSVCAVLSLTIARESRADDPPLPTSRLGLFPIIGAGYAHIGKSGVFVNDIGTTITGLELDGGFGRYGALGRVQFESSGQDGRWTGMSYALGGTYRIFGDGFDALSLVARAGGEYQHFRASKAGCDVLLFFPSNCKDFTPPPGSGVTGVFAAPHDLFDALGVFAGARIELPLHSFYVALDGEVAPAITFAEATSAMLQFRIGILFGVRSRRQSGDLVTDPTRGPHVPHRGTY